MMEPMGGTFTRVLASRLPPRARRAVRRSTDRLLAPVGSLRGVRTRERVVALTYDDGPDPRHTPAVLEALARHGVRATFFQLVYRAERHPDLVRAVRAGGHEIALHGVDHRRLTGMPPREVAGHLADARARLEAVAGTGVRLFRPAYGSQTVRTLLATRRAGLDVVVWGPTVEDWHDGTPQEVASRALPRLGPGEIMLLHDGFEVPDGDPTPPPQVDRGAVAEHLVGELAANGYRCATVGEMLASGTAWRTAWFRP